jgi:PhnB protein
MRELIMHMNFNGNCEEAINFYKHCFNAEIVFMQTYGESPMPAPDNYQSKIMHAEFKFGNIRIMGADAPPDKAPIIGTNLALTIDFESESELESTFAKLSEGGTVTMPVQDTFWKAKFGMLIDKFGFNWMFNYTIPQN